VAVTVAVLVSLVGLRGVRRWIRGRLAREVDIVTFHLVERADPSELIGAVHQIPAVEIRGLEVDRDEDTQRLTVRVRVKGAAGTNVVDTMAPLMSRPDVEETLVVEH
jgi:uncharacterized membrane protein YhiD involved in acid resistance